MPHTNSALPLLCLALLGVFSVAHAAPVRVLAKPIENAQQPQLAAGADGAVHLVFGANVTIPQPAKGWRKPSDGVIYHVVMRDGESFSAPAQIAALPKLALGMRRGPRIAVTDKALIVTAQSHEDGNVHAWISTDAGKIWKEQPRLNSVSGSAMEGLHALAGNGGSVVAAAWMDGRSGGGQEVWCRFSQDGGLTWDAERLVYRSPEGSVCPCCAPSIAVNGEGRAVIMWRNSLAGARDMYRAVTSDGGRTFGPIQKLGEGTWVFNACPMDGGALAWGADGEPDAVWRRETTVYFSDGKDAEAKLAGAAAQPIMARGKNGRTLLWESDGNLMVQRGDSKPVLFAEKARAAAIIALPDGGAAVAWEGQGAKGATILFEVVAAAAGK